MKKNFILKISIVSIVIIILGTFIYFNFLKKNDNKNTEDLKVTDSIINLPKLSSIDKNKYPLLYDYVNSSLGKNYDKDKLYFTEYNTFYAIMTNDDYKDYAWGELYTYGEYISLPILGLKPIKIKIRDLNAFKDYTSKISANRKYKEGKWNLYIVSLYKNSNNQYDYCKEVNYSYNWAGIELDTNFDKSDNGLAYKNIYDLGQGWDTKWLRKDIFVKIVKESGLNINDKFFDRYNYLQVLKYKNNKKEIKVQVTQLDNFKLEISKDNYVDLKEYELKEYLKSEGLE